MISLLKNKLWHTLGLKRAWKRLIKSETSCHTILFYTPTPSCPQFPSLYYICLRVKLHAILYYTIRPFMPTIIHPYISCRFLRTSTRLSHWVVQSLWMGLIIRAVIWKEGLFVIVNSQGQQVLAWHQEHDVFLGCPWSPPLSDLLWAFSQSFSNCYAWQAPPNTRAKWCHELDKPLQVSKSTLHFLLIAFGTAHCPMSSNGRSAGIASHLSRLIRPRKVTVTRHKQSGH